LEGASCAPFFFLKSFFENFNYSMKEKLLKHLKGFVTKERSRKIEEIAGLRTKYISVVLEDIYQSQNASAVLRSCECFGIQDVYIIENRNAYQVNPDVVLGANKWLNLHRHNSPDENNTASTITKLRNAGYRIIATSPHANDKKLEDFDLSAGKTALFFGNELEGLSDEIINSADEFLKIPMYGFTESFNVSVSVAIILHFLSFQLRNSGIHWQLSASEKTDLQLQWLKKSIKESELIEKNFYENIDKPDSFS
jgi:tRNA (guanosine-2'-O-)-methyltransferase